MDFGKLVFGKMDIHGEKFGKMDFMDFGGFDSGFWAVTIPTSVYYSTSIWPWHSFYQNTSEFQLYLPGSKLLNQSTITP